MAELKFGDILVRRKHTGPLQHHRYLAIFIRMSDFGWYTTIGRDLQLDGGRWRISNCSPNHWERYEKA